MKKKKALNFNETLKSWQVWVSSLVYHFVALILNSLMPKPIVNEANKIIFLDSAKYNIPKIADLSQIGANKPFHLNPAVIVNILIFDALFVLIFIIAKKSKLKHYNIFAVGVTAIITNILLILFIRSLEVNF